MKEWNLKEGDPLSLTLVADARLCKLDFLNDHIWELRLGGGDPPAVAAATTYGLRARGMRLFPRFKEKGAILSDPKLFWRPPAVHKVFPNYMLLTFSPTPGIDVVAEYWVPENETIAGRFKVTNSGVTPRKLEMELTAILQPMDGGQRLAPARIQEVAVLAGRTADLAPVVFLTGGSTAAPSPYPVLAINEELLPGLEGTWVWVQAASRDALDSFSLARDIAARSWEAEIARIELVNASQIEVNSGKPEWDASFAMGQKVALSLVHGPGPGLAHLSFVSSRTPDQGHSIRGDGMDYDLPWAGQTALETWYLARLLLPIAPLLVIDFLQNFLKVQNEVGAIDWKPGLSGNRSNLLATPILAHTAWRIFQFLEDDAFLAEVYPGLHRSFFSWFQKGFDRDLDGIPEWEHVIQTGMEDLSAFTLWSSDDAWVEISAFETPSLNAFLFREATTLVEMAKRLERDYDLPLLEESARRLRQATEESWDPKKVTYQYRDRDSHRTTSSNWSLELEGTVDKKFRQNFSPPARLNLYVMADRERRTSFRISVAGKDHQSRPVVDSVRPTDLHWVDGRGLLTLPLPFSALRGVTVEGLAPGDRVTLQTAAHPGEDMTVLLPLWAGIPEPRRAGALVRRSVLNPAQFYAPYGIRMDPPSSQHEEGAGSQEIDILWNSLIAEGVLRYGFRSEAADIFTRMMDGIVKNLKMHHSFRTRLHAETGEGMGDRDSLSGLPPLGLFLDILGVRLISPWKVVLTGENPYPWPVEVRYRGLYVVRGRGQTTVTFPDGDIVEIDDPADCVVER